MNNALINSDLASAKIIAFPGTSCNNEESITKQPSVSGDENCPFDFSSMTIGEAYTEDDMLDIKSEQAAEPIKNIEDIERLKQYLLERGKYRDYMMLVVGINTGLRYSDFSRIKFIDLIDPEKLGTQDPFLEELVLIERKTRNTKKIKVNRHIAINNSIKAAVALYLDHTPGVELGDYLFTSQSNHKGRGVEDGKPAKPISCYGIEHNFKGYAAAIGLDINFGTHTFRKTFGYQFMAAHTDDPRALLQLQKIFNHSSETITLKYIGITADEIRYSYNSLCL